MELELIIKKIKNQLYDGEEKIFDAWYQESENHRRYYQKVKKNLPQTNSPVDTKKGWRRVEKRAVNKSKGTYWKIASAASVAVLLGINFCFFDNNPPATDSVDTVTVEKTKIQIGANKAVLTLENGMDVSLSEEVPYQSDNIKSDGKELTYSKKDTPDEDQKEEQYNILKIPRGGQFSLVLSDGTKVWLNSETKLRYPVQFIGDVRKVELLYGEAYFDVSPSEDNDGTKFKVVAYNQEIEVLGTEFNVKAYKDDSETSSTLVEGSISLTAGLKKRLLDPGYQAALDRETNKIKIQKVKVYNEIAWRDGIFSFENTSLKGITTVLSRWYNVDFEFESRELENQKFNGVLAKKQEIDKILSLLGKSNNIKYEIRDKVIHIK